MRNHAETKVRRGTGKSPTPKRKPTGRAILEITTSKKQWPAKWTPPRTTGSVSGSARNYRKYEDLFRAPRGYCHRVKMINF